MLYFPLLALQLQAIIGNYSKQTDKELGDTQVAYILETMDDKVNVIILKQGLFVENDTAQGIQA